VSHLIARYWRFAKQHYRRAGETTRTIEDVRLSLRPLRRLYGHTPAVDFGPRGLKAIRQSMIVSKLSRRVINKRVRIIRQVFRWGTAEELVPPSVYQALQAVTGLQKGRTDAPERDPVLPVADDVVEATLSHLPPIVRDMVKLQRLTGTRPAEICLLRPSDVERTGELWEYRPEHHKTEHHGHQRVILLGPQAQEILRPYLLRPADAYCFSPAESEKRRRQIMRANRKTRVQPSQIDRSKRNAKRKPRDRYCVDAYRRAIHRAVQLANRKVAKEAAEAKARGEHVEAVLLPKWSPNQLRHTAGTAIRKQFGLEAAQVVLGHRKADVTEVYAERDIDLARRVIAQVG
jgi:integrase